MWPDRAKGPLSDTVSSRLLIDRLRCPLGARLFVPSVRRTMACQPPVCNVILESVHKVVGKIQSVLRKDGA